MRSVQIRYEFEKKNLSNAWRFRVPMNWNYDHRWRAAVKSGLLQFFCSELNRKWQDYVYIQCEYKSTKQKIKHLLREENKVKENKIS